MSKEETTDFLLTEIRQRGWHVAVHNDYHTQLAGWCTFWLFIKGFLAVKGEGRTDREALHVALVYAKEVEKAAIEADNRGVHLPCFVNLKPEHACTDCFTKKEDK